MTYTFSALPLKSFKELGSVITITGTYVMPSTPSGADTGAIIVADNTGGTTLGEVPGTITATGPNADPGSGEPKAGSTGGGSSDGGLVNQNAGSSGGCGGSSVMGEMGRASSATTACYSFIFSLLSLVPIAGRRITGKR